MSRNSSNTFSRGNTTKRNNNKMSRSKRDKDNDLRSHMSNTYGCKDKNDEESAMWIHRLKSGWFEDRARQTLESKKKRMVEEYENAADLDYRDGLSPEVRKEKIRNHIESVDDEIEYYEKTFQKRYNNDPSKARDARRRFKENDRRKVMYGNFSNREDIVTIKKFDNELNLFRDQIQESLDYMDSRLEIKEDEIGFSVAETIGEDVEPSIPGGDLSTFMSVTGFMIDEEKYWDFRDMDNYEYTIDDQYLDEFYHAIDLMDISIRADIDFTVVKRNSESIRTIRDKYLSQDELLNEIVLINHLRNGTSIRSISLDFRDVDTSFDYNIVFLASGSGKTSLVNRYGHLFVDGDLLNPFGTDRYIGQINEAYRKAYPDSWDELNAYHRSRIYGYRDFLVGKILLIQHPHLVPLEILSNAKILFLFRSDRTGIRMNQLNVEALLRYLSDMKKGLVNDIPIDNYCTVVSRYDNMFFEIVRYFKLVFKFRIKYKYKYRPHVRKPPLDW